MIWTLIALFVLAVSIFVTLIADVKDWYDVNFHSSVLVFLSGIALIIMVLIICFANVGTSELIYKAQMNRSSIVKRLEIANSEYEDISKSDVYKEAYDWNRDVHSEKYWASNPWTSWFYNQRYADALQYIDLEDK